MQLRAWRGHSRVVELLPPGITFLWRVELLRDRLSLLSDQQTNTSLTGQLRGLERAPGTTLESQEGWQDAPVSPYGLSLNSLV